MDNIFTLNIVKLIMILVPVLKDDSAALELPWL